MGLIFVCDVFLYDTSSSKETEKRKSSSGPN